jgi:hypothetical protein
VDHPCREAYKPRGVVAQHATGSMSAVAWSPDALPKVARPIPQRRPPVEGMARSGDRARAP